MPPADFPFDPAAWSRRTLLTCAEMRKAEELSCAKGPPDFYGLMQNAGRAVARVVEERWEPCRVLFLCGPGNNGGDGFVAAEALRNAGWPVVVGVLTACAPSADASRAAAAYEGEMCPLDAALLGEADIVVDALFGTGLQRPLEGEVAGFVEKLNASRLPVVAVDIPSGIGGDTGRVLSVAPAAQATVTFFRKKPGHILLPGARLCGEVVVNGIGMNEAVLEEVRPTAAENDPDLWRHLLPHPQAEGHKYDRGHALVYGGPVMTGAARLAARAAQRTGAGLVTLAAPEAAVPVYAAALESVIVRPVASPGVWRTLLGDPKINVALIGPGAGLDDNTKQMALEAARSRKPCVLDADALTMFENEPDTLFEALHPGCVLTPHEGEFARLFGVVIDAGGDKLSRARAAAARAKCVVLLKGADTVVAGHEGYAVINHNAPPWLATAGAGDVLGGMILGLLASGAPPLAAAAAAAYVHGHAAQSFGPGLIAEDIVANLPEALKDLLV